MTKPCGHKAEPGRKRCRDCRRKKSADRPSRTKVRRHGRRGQPVWKCLSESEWVAIWNRQRGLCPVCRTPLRNRYNPHDTTPAIANLDHDHAAERTLLAVGYSPLVALRLSLRGLLCYFDNRNTIHSLRDSADRAERAAAYLRDPPAASVGIVGEPVTACL